MERSWQHQLRNKRTRLCRRLKVRAVPTTFLLECAPPQHAPARARTHTHTHTRARAHKQHRGSYTKKNFWSRGTALSGTEVQCCAGTPDIAEQLRAKNCTKRRFPAGACHYTSLSCVTTCHYKPLGHVTIHLLAMSAGLPQQADTNKTPTKTQPAAHRAVQSLEIS